ncbi:MAG: tRNA (guanine-N7)-methyltransferase [Sandaracinaceae bacterium]|nr:tRNA (guanine-N7)-methyltransferase [Sandaracinaceae bacterium]
MDRAPSPPDGPVDLPSLIDGDAPLELDIGFGRGRSFIVRARARESRVIGIEIKAKWSFLVEERRIREGLDNARAFRADARELLERAGPDGCVRRAFVHFPDPWWKKRHTKRMVVTDTFLDTLARLIGPGGELYVQTDVEERADAYEALMVEHPAFEPRRLDDNPWAKSNREVRADEDGLPVYRILAGRL